MFKKNGFRYNALIKIDTDKKVSGERRNKL